VNERSDATSTEAITATIFLSLIRARARGEPWKTLAEEFLGPTALILKKISKTRAALLRQQEQPAQRVQAMNQKVLLVLERFADAIWKERGEDQRDPILAVIAPGTPSFFFEWEVGEPPDRIDVLLDVLMGDAPLPTATSAAAELRALLPEYRALCEELRALSVRRDLLNKAAEAVARAGHVQHSRLRRHMRAEGFEAEEVRNVLPDIPNVSTSDTLS
jgi:hypothetical protein